MEISGGVEAHMAYGQASQVKLNNVAQVTAKAQEAPQASSNQVSSENRPIAGGSVGSIINTSA